MSFTGAQLQAIHADHNTLVVAGAGAGKTSTLAARCIRLLTRQRDPVPIDQMLVVTFTDAAAAEVRHRIRQKLEEEFNARPADENLQRQIALLDSAHISTLHAFCHALVREHFFDLGLDPAVSVLSGEQSAVLRFQVLDDLLLEHYAGGHSFSREVQELIMARFGGKDERLRQFLFRLHDYTQTRPNPAAWLEAQRQMTEPGGARRWREWHEQALREWCQRWTAFLETLPAENANAHACAEILRAARGEDAFHAPERILAREERNCWPKGRKGAHEKPFKKIFDEARFLDGLTPAGDASPLEQDWEWSRETIQTLLRLGEQFTEAYGRAKHDRSDLDFHDLEQHSLKLLWDFKRNAPTPLALEWRGRFQAIFVDEYQDINAAQDFIIRALSREGAGNRFLVGDIKQSIYRFRQAEPGIFRAYLNQAAADGWEKAALSENFRSHEGIIAFINPLFAEIMREDFGGVAYGADAALRFGNPAGRAVLSRAADPAPAVEMHLLSDDAAIEPDPEEDGGEENDAPEEDNAEHEARLIARRLRHLKETFEFYDDRAQCRRRAEWHDMAILLRSVKNSAETYAKVFHEFGIPLASKRASFYTTQEVLDLLQLLHILDNPRQDIPLVAVLHSPFAGLTVTDLANIRAACREVKPFWTALARFHEIKRQPETWTKVDAFLSRFHRWRKETRSASLSQRLELILEETGYTEWLLAADRGHEKCANVRQLLRIAREFDAARGESLYLFLRHIEELQEAAGDIEPAGLGTAAAVRLMSIHQSKGLEFPVVVLGNCGKQFNLQDSRQGILLDERYGLCAHVQPPGRTQRYPSLPHWLAARRQKEECMAEELRVLYVALTRARNRLLIFGTASEKRREDWIKQAESPSPPREHLIKASSALDWIAPHLGRIAPGCLAASEGAFGTFTFHSHEAVPARPAAAPASAAEAELPASEDALRAASAMAEPYPHRLATLVEAKSSISILKRRRDDEDEDAAPTVTLPRGSGGLERGLAAHAFLEQLDLAAPLDPSGLQAQLDSLIQRGLLNEAQAAFLDLPAIARFWGSETGREILSRRDCIQRELPFTVRAEAARLRQLGLDRLLDIPEGEFVILQGIADLVVLLENEVWLLDFKTDQGQDLPRLLENYRPQLALYRMALEAIYRRPVTRQWLHFLTPGRTIDPEAPASPPPAHHRSA